MKRISIVLFMLVALVATACSDQEASSSGSASDAAGESQAAGESEAAGESQGAEESADDGDTGAVPSFDVPASAPELAALLPDEIGGQEAFKLSMSGAEMMGGTGEDVTVDQEFIDFLNRLGAQPDDISVAFSFGVGADESTAGVFAFRVEGANADQLETEFRATMEEESGQLDWQETSVAGKNVLAAEDPDNPGNTMYLYTAGDIIFIVTAADEATAVELLEPLP